jgi:hypothetical protein
MDVLPQFESDELINRVRSSRNEFEQEFGALVAEMAELRAGALVAEMAELRARGISMEQKVSSVELLSRSVQSEVEKVERGLKVVSPVVLAALSRRTHRKPGWKDRVKALPVPVLELHRNYPVVEVAAILGLKYDTALRRITTEMRFQDHGTRETRFKRQKRKITVSGKELVEYIRKHTESN